MAFAHWQLPRDRAIGLLGETQLEEWRYRFINLVRWTRVRLELGEGPPDGDAIQRAAFIASFPPDQDLPPDIDARMTTWRRAYIQSQNSVTTRYLVIALLGATVLGGPDGMPLRLWIANRAPDAWRAPPDERDGYHYEVWLGHRSNPLVVTEAICAMEDETLGQPWNAL